MSSPLIHCQLWMGGLEPYMTESFVMSAFQRMDEHPQNVKVMRNKFTGEPAGYCFVHFITDEAALNAMHKLSGKIIPNSQPPVRFKLNHASTTGRPPIEREFSLWVGDLTPEVDDYNLYRTFASRYPSVRTAKVILDNVGFSKGYGFIRFAGEEEQKQCLQAMNGYKGLGSKPLKISNAVPKPHRFAGSSSPTSGATSTTAPPTPAQAPPTGYNSGQDYSQYYDPNYWSSYSGWQNGYYEGATDPAASGYQMGQEYAQGQTYPENGNQNDGLELVDHYVPLDVDKMNRELLERDYNLWDALESSKWLPVEGSAASVEVN